MCVNDSSYSQSTIAQDKRMRMRNFTKSESSIFLKNIIFIFHERFNKLIYDINTIIKCGTGQPVKFQLVSRS